jgi:hypothetical protein
MREQDSATGSGVAEKEEGWLKVPTMVRGSAGVERRGEAFDAGLAAGWDGRGSTEAWFDSVAEGDWCCHDLSTTSCKRRQDSGRDDSEEEEAECAESVEVEWAQSGAADWVMG